MERQLTCSLEEYRDMLEETQRRILQRLDLWRDYKGRLTQVQSRGRHLQVIVIGHQHVGMQSHSKTLLKSCQQFLKFLVISFLTKDRPPFYPLAQCP